MFLCVVLHSSLPVCLCVLLVFIGAVATTVQITLKLVYVASNAASALSMTFLFRLKLAKKKLLNVIFQLSR